MSLFSPLAIAPMIDWTNSSFRILMRLLAPRALLYTEMQTANAIAHHPKRHLYYDPIEKPLALQLGGADPQALKNAALQAQTDGFDEINLNIGCPSDRVKSGQFGACLMAKPDLVAEIIKSLKEVLSLPITVKTRIGIDHQDDYEFFADFVSHLVEAGCDKLIVHARKAWLTGLSPKQNRTIPPINYDYVYRIKAAYPQLPVVINGNISDISAIKEHLNRVDGVMIGRLACQHPYAIAEIHHLLYPEISLPSRQSVVDAYCERLLASEQNAIPKSFLIRPLLNLAHGRPFASAWKQHLMGIASLREVDSSAFVD